MMQIIYSTQPRKAVTNNTHHCVANDPHWLISVVEGMRTLAHQSDTDAIVRVKRIEFEGRVAYMVKNFHNKTRVIMLGNGKKIYVYASSTPAPDLNSPYIPLFPGKGDKDCTELVLKMEAESLPQLASFCAEQMIKKTYYSDPNFARIKISAKSPREGCFVYDRIVSVSQVVRQNLPYWSIQTASSDSNYLVLCSAIRYDHVKPGYFLVYKNEESADVVSSLELDAFYEVVDESIHHTKH